MEYTRFLAMLPEVDILITSTGAPHYILHKDEMQRVIAARRNKPMFLIDIAVPRNIEPAVNELDNVFLYDIDDLQEVVNANLRERMKEADHAEELVAEEVERMMARLKVQPRSRPTIVSLQEQLEQIRAGELEKVRRKFGPAHAASRRRPWRRSPAASSTRSRTARSPNCARTPASPKAPTSSPPSERRSTFRTDSCSSSARAVRNSRSGRPAGWRRS